MEDLQATPTIFQGLRHYEKSLRLSIRGDSLEGLLEATEVCVSYIQELLEVEEPSPSQVTKAMEVILKADRHLREIQEFPGHNSVEQYQALVQNLAALKSSIYERDLHSREKYFQIYNMVSDIDSFADVDLHCGFVSFLLSEGMQEAAFEHVIECSELFSSNIRWAKFLLDNFPLPDNDQSEISQINHLRVVYYALDCDVRLRLEQTHTASALTALAEFYNENMKNIKSLGLRVMEKSTGSLLREEYEARFYWHYGVSQLRLLARQPNNRLALQTAFLAFRMALSAYLPKQTPPFLRKLANERWCGVSRLLLSMIQAFSLECLDYPLQTAANRGPAGIVHNENPTVWGLKEFLQIPRLGASGALPKLEQLEKIIVERASLGRAHFDFTDGDFICSNAWDLRRFVLAACWAKSLREWTHRIFSSAFASTPEPTEDEEPADLSPTLIDVEVFITALMIQAHDLTQHLGPRAWFQLLTDPTSWSPTSNHTRFWLTLLQQHGSMNYSTQRTLVGSEMTDEELSRAISELRGLTPLRDEQHEELFGHLIAYVKGIDTDHASFLQSQKRSIDPLHRPHLILPFVRLGVRAEEPVKETEDSPADMDDSPFAPTFLLAPPPDYVGKDYVIDEGRNLPQESAFVHPDDHGFDHGEESLGSFGHEGDDAASSAGEHFSSVLSDAPKGSGQRKQYIRSKMEEVNQFLEKEFSLSPEEEEEEEEEEARAEVPEEVLEAPGLEVETQPPKLGEPARLSRQLQALEMANEALEEGMAGSQGSRAARQLRRLELLDEEFENLE